MQLSFIKYGNYFVASKCEDYEPLGHQIGVRLFHVLADPPQADKDAMITFVKAQFGITLYHLTWRSEDMC